MFNIILIGYVKHLYNADAEKYVPAARCRSSFDFFSAKKRLTAHDGDVQLLTAQMYINYLAQKRLTANVGDWRTNSQKLQTEPLFSE